MAIEVELADKIAHLVELDCTEQSFSGKLELARGCNDKYHDLSKAKKKKRRLSSDNHLNFEFNL